MNQITNLADEADQVTNVVLGDGSVVTFEFMYNAAVERWVFNVSHSTVTLTGENLCAGPNVLRQYRNVIPFGLACLTTDGADPFYIEDFSSGRVTLYVLSAAEVASVETTVFGPQAVAA